MKLLIAIILSLFVGCFVKAQSSVVMKLPTNANDTLVMWEMYATNNGAGDGVAKKEYLGKRYIFSDMQLRGRPGGSEAKFPGGGEALDIFFNSNFKFHDREQIGKITGNAIVEYNGRLSDITISSVNIDTWGKDKEVEKEIIKILRHAPRWIPGVLNNKRVKSRAYFVIRANAGS